MKYGILRGADEHSHLLHFHGTGVDKKDFASYTYGILSVVPEAKTAVMPGILVAHKSLSEVESGCRYILKGHETEEWLGK
jgi:predicted esterase